MKRDSLDALVLSETEDENSSRWQLGPVLVAGTIVVAGAAGLLWTSRAQAPAAAAEAPRETAISGLVRQYRESGTKAETHEGVASARKTRETTDAWNADEKPATTPATRDVEPVADEPGETSAPELAETTGDADQPPADGKYYLQAGSFEVRETAERVAQRLHAKGFEAFATAYGGPKAGWWHVVRIGPFDSRVAAETSRLELDATTRDDAYVLPRSNGAHHVQVASLHDAQQAERLAVRIRRQGHRARVVTLGPAGPSQWHCVRVGPFDDRAEAEGYRKLMVRHGIDGQVIPFVGE